ncbi:hypothetical protein P3339_18690 [Microbulbifer sp. MLAF003]|uniref:hypothetical protein n=1 Tax=unclassified Microbulbifer TaxID=2619833 RepID=UPI0024AD36D4|nr:hypothetical protein [Microbulbifer sp. MLAF003]WHI50447.1 hypothetical protein P3339_18690 [Microbulbifer sp. MLAF003]
MKTFSTFFLLGSISISVSAETTKWLAPDNIQEFYPDRGGVNVVLAKVSSDYSICNDGRRFYLPLTHPNYEVTSSTLLTSFASGKRVKLIIKQISGCAPEIDRVVLVNY